MVEVISVANVEQWYTTQCEWTSRFTVHYLGDACPLSCVNAEACLTGWPKVWVCRGGGS